MKKNTLPTGGFLITTLALMLLLIVAACENDDDIPFNNTELKFYLGPDLNLVVGEPTTLKSADPRGQFFKPPIETVWTWRLLDQPDNSTAVLSDADKVSAILNADMPGEYQIELSGTLEGQYVVDTLLAYAHSVARLDRTYQVLFETDGTINSLCLYQDKLYAAGYFSRIGGVIAYGIASYDGNSWKPLGSGLQDDYNSYFGSISDMIEYQGELYITGVFGAPGGINSPAIARWNGHQWVEVPGLDLILTNGDWGPYFENYGQSFEIFDDELYIEGNFRDNRQAQQDPVPYSIMKWDGNQLTGVSTPFPLGGLKADRNHLYAIGGNLDLVSFDGSDWKELVTVNKGSEYSTVGLIAPYQEKLLLSVATDTRGLEIYTWDGTQLDAGIPFSRKPYNYISATNVIDDKLFFAGYFVDEVVGAKSSGLVSYDGQQWGVIEGSESTTISSIQTFQNQLFMAGYFNHIDTHAIATLGSLD